GPRSRCPWAWSRGRPQPAGSRTPPAPGGVRSENSETPGVATAGSRTGGHGGRGRGGVRRGGSAWSSHFAARSAGACRQQAGSGHSDFDRICDSLPSNQRTWANGTPTLMAKSPPGSTRAVHQNEPCGGSVYWSYGLNRSATRKTVREVKRLHANCPSIAPSGSVGKGRPSFEYALWIVPELWTFMKWTGRPRCS